MSDATTKRMISAYMDDADAPMFLSGFFQSPPRNFHTTEMVEIDIERDDPEVAIVVTDLKAGGRKNEIGQYTNKGFTPPIFKEEGVITAFNLMKRRPGQNPFQDPNFLANATEEAFRLFRKLEKKIRRAIELQASQVLQTGVLTLINEDGVAAYTLDFQPKSTHFPAAAATWAGASDKLLDLENLADVIRRDGKSQPRRLVFGQTALRRFLADSAVQARLDSRNMTVGSIAPETRGQGATFQGWVWIGHYRFEMWTYDGFYKHPQTGVLTPYVGTDNVIMLSEGSRLDLTYGAIPMIRGPETRALPFLPPRMSDGGLGLDLTTNSWFSPDGETLNVSAGTRPLTIPTAIDTFGCLDTTT
ncbi:MAG: major capsid protein [Myxococcota bacterium]|nr:major capsid protein [Myxococcota bacterium]